jgi:hypothetical protein
MITILGGLYIYLVLGVTFYVISYPSPKSKTPETLECSGSVLFGAQFCCLFKKTVGQLPGQLPRMGIQSDTKTVDLTKHDTKTGMQTWSHGEVAA